MSNEVENKSKRVMNILENAFEIKREVIEIPSIDTSTSSLDYKEKVLLNSLPRGLQIKLYHGWSLKELNEIKIVELSTMNVDKVTVHKYFKLSDIEKQTTVIKESINSIVPLGPGVIRRILEYVYYLRKNGMYEVVDDIDDRLAGSMPQKIIMKYYDMVYSFIIENPCKIASKVKKDFNSDIHFGACLDTPKYTHDSSSEKIVAITCDALRNYIWGIDDTKVLGFIKRGLRDLGCLSYTSDDCRLNVALSENNVKKCIIFKIDKKYLAKE